MRELLNMNIENARRATSRRAFLAGAGALSLAWPIEAAPKRQTVRLGVITDVHKDVMHDADGRLTAFVEAARAHKSDFVIQLGDFCRPYDKNRGFLQIWNSFAGPRHHVLGNHEIDGGFTWEQAQTFLGMDRAYYSFDSGGWHFIVLNGNEKVPDARRSGYPRYIGAEQLGWLREDLKRTAAPTIVWSHQSLEDVDGVENSAAVREVLERCNAEAGWGKAGVCFSGHHHIDFHRTINGIHYVQVNSASYSWLGSDYEFVRYSAEIDRAYPHIKYTAPYALPLFAMVTLHADGRIEVKGRRTEFVGPSPWQLGMRDQKGTSRDSDRLAPAISDRVLRVG